MTVLRDGRRLATVQASETNAGELVQMIVGRSMNDAFVRPAPPSGLTRSPLRNSSPNVWVPFPSLSLREKSLDSSACVVRAIIRSGARSSVRPHDRGTLARRRADRASSPAEAMAQGGSASCRADGPKRASPKRLAFDGRYASRRSTGQRKSESQSRSRLADAPANAVLSNLPTAIAAGDLHIDPGDQLAERLRVSYQMSR